MAFIDNPADLSKTTGLSRSDILMQAVDLWQKQRIDQKHKA
ncbi:hypothetical protein [Moraxella macacae]|nr:hypothetical protein [Moraxella macacae]